MKYKNFKWKFANSIMILIAISLGIIFSIATIILAIASDFKYTYLVLIIFVIILIPSYFILLLIGDLLFHKSKIRFGKEGIYQNKRLLRYDSIKEIYYGKIGQICWFQINPIKDGIFISKRIIVYFYSKEELFHFVIVNDFINNLKYYYQYNEVISYIDYIINEYKEELHQDYKNIYNNLKKSCDCCNNKTIFKKSINEICPVCYWEQDNDNRILYDPNSISDLNQISLSEARNNYKKFHACKEEYINNVRKPYSFELKDIDL